MDPAAIERLVQFGGKRLAVEMIDLFFDYAPKILTEAQSALPAGDLRTLARVGHSLRSSARNLGANRLLVAAQAVERAATDQQTTQLPAQLAELAAAFQEVRAHLAKRRQELAP